MRRPGETAAGGGEEGGEYCQCGCCGALVWCQPGLEVRRGVKVTYVEEDDSDEFGVIGTVL